MFKIIIVVERQQKYPFLEVCICAYSYIIIYCHLFALCCSDYSGESETKIIHKLFE